MNFNLWHQKQKDKGQIKPILNETFQELRKNILHNI